MIKYKLKCKKCSFSFDSWFANSNEFERIKKLNLLNCNLCNSKKIEKSLMAPTVINKKSKHVVKNDKKFNEIKNKIKEYQDFIKNNFEFVGDNFAYKARSIHYNNKKNKKGIYGNATIKEVKELKDEGIETEMFPWISENDN
tara:strand:- start:751 stop:1176 length:426 start_codon:yes stop_codon:yes gene_type:complete